MVRAATGFDLGAARYTLTPERATPRPAMKNYGRRGVFFTAVRATGLATGLSSGISGGGSI